MTALRDRSTTARTVDRALAQLTGALKHGGFGTNSATERPRRGRRRRRATATAAATEIDHVDLKVSAERQRIAGALHDDVSQLLFAMAARARRAHDLHPDDPAALRDALGLIAEQLQEAQERVRGVIRACGPASASDTVPTAAQRDLDDFTDRTGVSADLLLRGRPVHLAAPVERVALSCLRQALFNIERHAHARLVVVTLDYQSDRLAMVVQDDGRGLPDGFEPRAVPADGHHWGFTSMAEQVERLGGSVLLRRVPDEGGTQLRVELPRPVEAR